MPLCLENVKIRNRMVDWELVVTVSGIFQTLLEVTRCSEFIYLVWSRCQIGPKFVTFRENLEKALLEL